MTEWRPIPGYESNYHVSDGGQVKSLPRNTTRGGILRPAPSKQPGYPSVVLWRDGKQRTFKVHQLVAAAFLGPRPDGMEVRHLNGDRLDCRLANLRYGTRAENAQDTIDHGRNRNVEKTHCPNGHPYDASNTYRRPRNPRTRYCRQCNNVRTRARYARSR
jgi:hypothetical protein